MIYQYLKLFPFLLALSMPYVTYHFLRNRFLCFLVMFPFKDYEDYTRRDVKEMSWWHRFFCSCTYVKVSFTDTFLKCRFSWKVEIFPTFPLLTNVAFFLNKSFLSIHLNKTSHYNEAYSQSIKGNLLGTLTWTTIKYQKSF